MLAIVGDPRDRTVDRRSPSSPPGRGGGVIEHVSFVAPQSHQLLSTWMRASDVVLVPSAPRVSGSWRWSPRPAARRRGE